MLLVKDNEYQRPYYKEAFNSPNRFWKELFAYCSDAGVEMAATYHSILSTVRLHGCSYGTTSVHLSKIPLTDAGTMSIWCLAKSLWLQADVNFKNNYLTQLGLGHCLVP